MRSAVPAAIVAAAGFFAASMLGVAVAEAPTSTPLRTISVQGIATLPLGRQDNAAAATAVYREGMAGAVADGQSKAGFLAGKASATLGPVQSVVEGGGYITCTDGESGYAEYEGEQPDFGSAPQPGGAPVFAAAPKAAAGVPLRPISRRRKRKHPVAKKAAAATCTLTAQVSLVYAIT
jgi:hypothetical protein